MNTHRFLPRSGVLGLWGVFALVAAACDGPSDGTTTGNLGIEGASCVKSPDCQSPLQCIYGVCQEVSERSDTSSAVFPTADAATPDADTGPDKDAPAAAWDTPAVDPGVPDAGPHEPDAAPKPEISPPEVTPPQDTQPVNPFSDCGGLGIGPIWDGTFAGTVNYDLDPPPGLGLSSEPGALIVGGSLGFEIACLEGKLIVKGTMSGEATAAGTIGSYPFSSELAGSYVPSTGHLKAQMVDGKVVIYGFVEVYFAGTLEGDLQPDGTFAGTWKGTHAGNNLNLQGTADGNGTWKASEAP